MERSSGGVERMIKKLLMLPILVFGGLQCSPKRDGAVLAEVLNDRVIQNALDFAKEYSRDSSCKKLEECKEFFKREAEFRRYYFLGCDLKRAIFLDYHDLLREVADGNSQSDFIQLYHSVQSIVKKYKNALNFLLIKKAAAESTGKYKTAVAGKNKISSPEVFFSTKFEFRSKKKLGFKKGQELKNKAKNFVEDLWQKQFKDNPYFDSQIEIKFGVSTIDLEDPEQASIVLEFDPSSGEISNEDELKNQILQYFLYKFFDNASIDHLLEHEEKIKELVDKLNTEPHLSLQFVDANGGFVGQKSLESILGPVEIRDALTEDPTEELRAGYDYLKKMKKYFGKTIRQLRSDKVYDYQFSGKFTSVGKTLIEQAIDDWILNWGEYHFDSLRIKSSDGGAGIEKLMRDIFKINVGPGLIGHDMTFFTYDKIYQDKSFAQLFPLVFLNIANAIGFYDGNGVISRNMRSDKSWYESKGKIFSMNEDMSTIEGDDGFVYLSPKEGDKFFSIGNIFLDTEVREFSYGKKSKIKYQSINPSK